MRSLAIALILLTPFSARGETDCLPDGKSEVFTMLRQFGESVVAPVCATAQNLDASVREELRKNPWAGGGENLARRAEGAKVQCRRSFALLCESPDIRASISEKELAQHFEKWKRDPLLRMRAPEVFCMDRATVLAKRLNDLGIRAEIRKVDRSPLMLGVVRDAEGRPSGYHNYGSMHDGLALLGGMHAYVRVMVPGKDGKLLPMALDPQFQETPVPEQDFWRKTTGQVCGENSVDVASCSVESLAPNEFLQVKQEAGGFFAPTCGWPGLAQVEAELASVNDSKINTATPIPAGCTGKEDLEACLRSQEMEKFSVILAERIQRAQRFLAFTEEAATNDFADPANARREAREKLTKLEAIRARFFPEGTKE